MPSVISAGTTTGSAIAISGDTTGNLAFQTNGTTTAMTIDTSQNVGVVGNLSFNSGYGSVATAYGCRAWVNFNGTGTPAIREDGNVSSITDNSTGDYTVNFTTAMPDANYSFVSSAFRTTDETFVGRSSVAPTTGAVRLLSFNRAGATVDPDYFLVAIFR